MKTIVWVALAGAATIFLLSVKKLTTSNIAHGADGALLDSGIASWYGTIFNGRQTANGEIFDENLMTAAHRTLRLGTVVDVVNLENGRAVRVRINDRGPFTKDASGTFSRQIDLSKGAARALNYVEQGLTRVEVRAVA